MLVVLSISSRFKLVTGPSQLDAAKMLLPIAVQKSGGLRR
jgi:hypothetical protein